MGWFTALTGLLGKCCPGGGFNCEVNCCSASYKEECNDRIIVALEKAMDKLGTQKEVQFVPYRPSFRKRFSNKGEPTQNLISNEEAEATWIALEDFLKRVCLIRPEQISSFQNHPRLLTYGKLNEILEEAELLNENCNLEEKKPPTLVQFNLPNTAGHPSIANVQEKQQHLQLKAFTLPPQTPILKRQFSEHFDEIQPATMTTKFGIVTKKEAVI